MPPIFATRLVDDARVVGVDATSARMPCAPVSFAVDLNVCVVAAGEHDLVSGLAGLLNDGGANALAAAGDEKIVGFACSIMPRRHRTQWRGLALLVPAELDWTYPVASRAPRT